MNRHGTPLPTLLFPRSNPENISIHPCATVLPDGSGRNEDFSYTDDEIIHLCATAPHSQYGSYSGSVNVSISAIYILGPTLLVKTGPVEAMRDEYSNHAYAATVFADTPQIGVPTVCRFFARAGRGYMLFHGVEGERLDEILEEDGRAHFYVPLLKAAIETMQSFGSPIPGSVGGGYIRGWPRTDTLGFDRFASFAEFEHTLTRGYAQAVPPMGSRRVEKMEFHEQQLVFTHKNLQPENIVVQNIAGRPLKIYILDWVVAGFYPKCYEFGAFRSKPPFVGSSSQTRDYYRVLVDWMRNQSRHDLPMIARLDQIYQYLSE